MATELTKDIAELEKLRKTATRGNVQKLMDDTLNAWNLKLDDINAKCKSQANANQLQQSAVKVVSSSNSVRPVKKLTTYAYDESDKYVKLYYSIPSIQNTAPENIVSNISEDSFNVICKDVSGVDYEVVVKGILHPVDGSKSVVKPKTDSLLVMLKKKKEGEEWKSLLKLHKTQDIKMPKMDEKSDPQDSLMSMMKTMYDDGDDEMKRTIKKAWHESQSKKGGELPDSFEFSEKFSKDLPSMGFIEQTVIENYSKKGVVGQHDGYTSMAIIYAVFTFANFVAAPIVNALNAKRAMVFGGITYCLFQVGFLFLNKAYLYLSSALIGLGAGVIWTAQGKYLALNSTDETLVFSDKINDETMHILYGVFTVMTLIGIVILGALRLPTTVVPNISTESGIENILEPQLPLQETHLTHMQVIGSTIRLTLTKRMLLMAIAFAYSGVELSFWSAIYPTCITSTSKLVTNTALVPNTKTLLGLNAIAQGLGQASSVILGALVHLVAFIGIFINFPALAPLYPTDSTGLIEPRVSLALFCGFLLGFGDACWNTQIFAFLITKYSSKSAQAFSLFKFFQSLLTCAAFFYSSTLMLQYHLAILVVGAVIACTAFFLAERMPSNEDDDQQVPHND
uniref:UNC93-like protein MFSD11 n=1 Tax=Ditylenchus dipsaci TaxID=166011 RepID=A0A915EGB9_9BILA